MSQEQLGQAINYSAALVGRVEIGERVPSLDFARRCDEALASSGLFAHLRDSMNSDVHAFPRWFREFVEHEREAASIRESTRWPCQGFCKPRTMRGLLSGLAGRGTAMTKSSCM
ncbi:MAG: helix-turn-helix domain-containing protein [Streptosporangiaceae bacterium]